MSFSADIGIILLVILLNGFFAMSELAIVSSRRARLKQMAEDGSKGAQIVLDMNEDPSSFLSIVQTGMTVNSIFAGAFGGATLSGELAEYLNTLSWIEGRGEPVALALTVAAITYLTLVIGELVPKRIALAHAEKIAIRVVRPMRIFALIAAPVVWFLTQSTRFFLHLLRMDTTLDQSITEDEIKSMIAEGSESGALHPAEKDMMEGVMRLADRTVRSIMTPRMDMIWLNIDELPRDHMKTIRNSGFSRFPVARGDMEEILGVVHAKDLLNATFDGLSLSLKTVMRAPLIVPDTTPVLRLLEQFKKEGKHIAMVVDEYGSVEGLVSITDIVESITGGLPGRNRETLTDPVENKDGSWLLDGMMPIDEAEAMIGFKNMRVEGNFQTVGGFVLDHLGRIPVVGDHFIWEGARFDVLSMDGRRIEKVRVVLPKEDAAED